jgi:O-antigen ligase
VEDKILSQQVAAAAVLLALPWLNPITYGPTHAVVQFLTVWFGAAGFYLIGDQARLQRENWLNAVAVAWLLAATASAVMGLLQYLGHAAQFSPWVNYVEAGQAYANLRQRNQQATLLAIGLCVLPWWQARLAAKADLGRGRGEPLRWTGWVALGLAAIVIATADAAAGSRTGILQLVLLSALALWWKRGRAAIALVLVAYAIAAFSLPRWAGLDPMQSGILGRIGEASSLCSSRITLWSNVLHLIAQKPWTGWGWGELDYAHFMTLYAGPRFCEILGNAHNLPLHLAVELGVPFAVLVCGTMLWLVLRARPWREQDATRQMAWSVLAVIGLHSLLEYPLWYGPFQLAALMAVWMLWRTPASAPAPANLPVALACAFLLACSYAAWDYWRISQIYLPEAQRAPAYRDNTLEKIRGSWLFDEQVKFAELGITPLTADNAEHIHALALEMLHFSPEASVVAKVIDSAERLGLPQEAAAFETRFAAAYPQEFASWQARKKESLPRDKTP